VQDPASSNCPGEHWAVIWIENTITVIIQLNNLQYLALTLVIKINEFTK
jgi:hypothetical protein